MLNGYPDGQLRRRARRRKLIEAIDKPAIVLSGTSLPRLTGEIGFAAGYSGYLGSGLAYTVSYTKETSLEEGIRNYQYLDRLAALYHEHGVELHRRQPGFLTGTNIPPSHRDHHLRSLDALLAATQGVQATTASSSARRCTSCRTPPRSACAAMLVQEYLQRSGFHDVFTPVTLAALDGRVAARRGAGGGAHRLRRHAGGDRRRQFASPPSARTRPSASRRPRPMPRACG